MAAAAITVEEKIARRPTMRADHAEGFGAIGEEENVIDTLRAIRSFAYRVSNTEILGIHIDIVLHFIIAFGLVVLLRTFLSLKKSVYITLALVAMKEFVDVCVKSRAEYIRPPKIDALVDIGFGIMGIALGMWFLKSRENRKRRNARSRIEK